MSFNPFLPTPLTDFLFIVAPQHSLIYEDPICQKIEAKFMNCLEAYGTLKAREKCAEYMYDLIECTDHVAQNKRTLAMKEERKKQYKKGQLPKPFEEYPPVDSFMY